MANENIGEITCPICQQAGDVRRYKNGKRLYWACGCGIIRPATQIGQDFILERATIWGAGGKPEQAGGLESVPLEKGPPIVSEDPSPSEAPAFQTEPETLRNVTQPRASKPASDMWEGW